MGDRGGSSRPGVCKWHPRQQGEGVCAICLRTSLEKLAIYQGEYQEESVDTYTGGFSSTSVAEFSRERDNVVHSFQPTYPNVSYRTRSKKESKPKRGFTSQDASTSDSRGPKDTSSSKAKLSWRGAAHRIASIRTAFTSLWKSDKQPEDKRKQSTGARDKHHGKAHGQNGTEEGNMYEQHSESGQVNGDSKRHSTSSSSFISRFTHRSSNVEDSQSRWRRSKSTRDAKSDPDVLDLPSDRGPQPPDGSEAYDAPSPLQPVPHPSSKSSPWRFFSRSGSRRSPYRGSKAETFINATPRRSTAMASDSRGSPFTPKAGSGVSISKSALSSPFMAKPEPPSHASVGSKSTSWSRTLSPSSSKPSPLYLAPRAMEIERDSLSRDSIDGQEFLDQIKPVDVQGQKGTRLSVDGVQDSTSPHSYEDFSKPYLPSNAFLQDPGMAQHKTDRSSVMSVTHRVDWPRVMLVQAPSKAPFFKRPEIPRGGSETRKLGSEAPLHMTGRGKASVAS